MKTKGMLNKISCITLAGLIALSGQVLANEDTRSEAINKIEQSNAGTIMVDKVLGYGSNYDLRLYEYLEPKDPGITNSTWAITASQLLELKTGITYSAKHIDYATAYNSTTEGTPNAHNRYLGQGGNMMVALGYLASGRGAVTENEFKWDGKLDKTTLSNLNSKTLSGRLESYRIFPSIYKMTFNTIDGTLTYAFSSPAVYQVDNADEVQNIGAYQDIDVYTGGQIEENRAQIKEHIIKYGAVSANIYMDIAYTKPYKETIEYYRYEYDDYTRKGYTLKRDTYDNLSYYCNSKNQTPNRNVIIIGWDDEIQVPGAPGRGAYLVFDQSAVVNQYYTTGDTNGWRGATEWVNGMKFYVGNLVTTSNNFYYVSYYDYYIESQVYGIKEFSVIRNGKEPYQWDKLGLSTVIETETSGSYAYGANVWARNTENAESLDSISIANMENTKYEIYVNPKSGDLSSENLIKVAETDVLDAGYNTIYFDESIMLTGKKFAVAVKYISPNPYEKTAKIGVQSPTMKTYDVNGTTATPVIKDIQYWENATSAQGRSFVGTTLDSWTDLYENDETKNMNICIKAYTSEVPGYKVPAESVEIQKMSDLGVYEEIEESVQILKGDQARLGVKVLPEDAANKEVNWSTSNKSVVTVDKDGTINAVGAGKATITAKLKNAPAIYATCVIDVRVPIKSFVLNKNNVTILAGETNVLAGIIGPEDATTTKIEWTSSNKEVVKVTEDGLLIGLKKGSAIVTAVIRDEAGVHTATCKVTVPESLVVDVLGVTLNKTSLTLEKGTRETLNATITPADATNTAVVWTSSNKNVAIVNANGRITALSPGTTTITVTTVSGGETATCNVTVTDVATVEPTGISISQTALTLEKDAKAQLTAMVAPSNAANKTVIWDSTDLNVAEVDSTGRVTAIDTGTATITATTYDGKYVAKCTVTVTKPTIKVTGVTLDRTALTLEKDATDVLIAGTQPANADNTLLTWKSNNPDVVTVDENGKITAVGYGTATITVTTDEGGYSKTCIVTVPEKIAVTGIELSREEITVLSGRTANLTVSVLPKEATNTNITYEISDEKTVALVENGVKGLKEGKATITFKTEDGNFTKTCTITVEAVPEDKITIDSDEYQIGEDNIISSVSPNTTVGEFKEAIKTDGTIIVKDKDGNVLEDTDFIGTGSKVEISKEIEKVPEEGGEPEKVTIKEEFTVKVNGDVNGDGKMSLTDLSVIKQYVMGETNLLEGIFLEAADLNGDGKVSLTDLSIIKGQIISNDETEEGNE